MNEKTIFSQNLRKLRNLKGWSQEKAASMIGIGRPAYGAWEEARGFPGPEGLIKACQVFGVKNVIGFLNDPNFNVHGAIENPEFRLTDLQQKYLEAPANVKVAVNSILNLVDLS